MRWLWQIVREEWNCALMSYFGILGLNLKTANRVILGVLIFDVAWVGAFYFFGIPFIPPR